MADRTKKNMRCFNLTRKVLPSITIGLNIEYVKPTQCLSSLIIYTNRYL